MGEDIRIPVPYSEAPDYPTYAQAQAYAEDFRTGAAAAYLKDERWAKYWLSGYLDILTSLLQANIYAVIAYPPAGFEVAYASDIEGYERFRGWIIQYDPATELWTLLVSSQEVGMDEFKRLRQEYKEG